MARLSLASTFLVGASLGMLVSAWTSSQHPMTTHARVRKESISSVQNPSFLRAGADIEQPPFYANVEKGPSQATKPTSDGDIPLQEQSPRGKVNEIDFCIAPADVSLSRAYMSGTISSNSQTDAPILSLTRALNDASNRAVRRILLARSWPSAEALNLSLRLVTAAAEKERGPKCPVPRSILNVLTRQRGASKRSGGKAASAAAADTTLTAPKPRSRTDEQYVADQMQNFQQRYGTLPGYAQAQDYLQAILSLATSGVEAETVPRILEDGVYDESYKRVLGVLKTAGVVFEIDPTTQRRRIAARLVDQDICLSMLDKIRLRKEQTNDVNDGDDANVNVNDKKVLDKNDDKDKKEKSSDEITKEDLGGVLLSASEPTMTRQLNSLANIVQRALLFGGDQELLVLAETLDADRAAFVERWYPDTGELAEDVAEETRPGAQFLNCMVELLRNCYTKGVVSSLEPPLPLLTSYANAYERLVASAVELGSGYLKPVPSDIMALPKPRTATEELGRFAVWESTFRQSQDAVVTSYPEDMVGTWEVRDEIGGETIGVSKVVFLEEGNVKVDDPLEGLRWRLDPGPTHLDTCTFQVLSSDGTILQYRGFIDRGARLEARFSGRSIRIRGSVMFQMRDGSLDYYKDMLPINYRTGTTKFVMTKVEDKK